MEQEVTHNSQQCINYNYFFNPNVCHVCKLDEQSKLNLCPECHMISYCSEDHRLLHRNQHEEICCAIVNIRKRGGIGNTRDMTPKEWVQFKMNNVELVKHELSRELEPYEQQMFLFAKSCLICRQQNNLVSACTCQSVNKCLDHIFANNDHNCLEVKQCFFFDVYSSLTNNQEKSIPEELLGRNIHVIYDMQSIIHYGLHTNCDTRSCNLSFDEYIHTDKLSGPLTLFHGMLDANLLDLMALPEFFIVHIIAGSFMDFHSLSAWEILLHEFNVDATLLIVMIEPHLPDKYEIVRVCQTCVDEKKILQFDYHHMPYYSYTRMLYSKPNVIMMLNAEFKDNTISTLIIKALQREACPILLTTKSESKASEMVTKIREVLGLALIPVINKKNKFASCRSYRDYENNSVYFPNQHVVIFRNLLNPDDEA